MVWGAGTGFRNSQIQQWLLLFQQSKNHCAIRALCVEINLMVVWAVHSVGSVWCTAADCANKQLGVVWVHRLNFTTLCRKRAGSDIAAVTSCTTFQATTSGIQHSSTTTITISASAMHDTPSWQKSPGVPKGADGSHP